MISGNVFENIYETFENIAESLGLDEIFGSYAAVGLITIILVIVIFIILIIVALLTTKSVEIICTDRIKEIDPDDKAVFEISLKNPTKKNKIYQLSFDKINENKWEKTIDREKISVEGKNTGKILLTVCPTDKVEHNEWTETILNANVNGKKKQYSITLMTMVKDGKTLLQLKDVFHWPKDFKNGEKVITSFKLYNKGNISARDINVILLVNGKKKNNVAVTIPSKGYADIRLPWIALKGKNNIHIKVEE